MTIRAGSLNTANIFIMWGLFVFLEIDCHGMAGCAEFSAIGVVEKSRETGERYTANEKNDQANTYHFCGSVFQNHIPSSLGATGISYVCSCYLSASYSR